MHEHNGITRQCDIALTDKPAIKLYFKLPLGVPILEDEDAESYLLAAVFFAMAQNCPIHVHGKVSQLLLRHLTELMHAWHCWLPDQYQVIDIIVDNLDDTPTQPLPGAIGAFSGGVDASFSFWQHSQGRLGHLSQSLKAGVLVHGFDIPLDDQNAFEMIFNQAQQTLANINLPLLPVKTNFREVLPLDWEHVFSTALVAVLANFKQLGGQFLVGSSEPYNALVLPWGSSPVTDYLLSAASFTVWHDGAGYSRTAKVAALADRLSGWPTGINHLRVCWEGQNKQLNCGVCEKCLRTKLNFLATGKPVPACFENPSVDSTLIMQTRRLPPVALGEWSSIQQAAVNNGIKATWLKALSSKIRRDNMRNRLGGIYKALMSIK